MCLPVRVSIVYVLTPPCLLFDRVSVPDGAMPVGIGPSDDDNEDFDEDDHDFGTNTWSSAEDDEKDSSSVSSKGDAEQPEDREVRTQ